MTDTSPDFAGIDLDAERKSRAAQREATGQELPIRLGGKVIATLPAELPLSVFSPLRVFDQELAMLMRSAVDAARAQQSSDRWDATDMVISLLASNPALPTRVLDVIGEVAKGLFGEDGYAALLAERLTKEDVAVLAKGVFRWYGVTLGEASAPSESSEGSGTTLTPTSSTTTASTPEESGSDLTTQGSLESVGS